jgi:hypothetical protein
MRGKKGLTVYEILTTQGSISETFPRSHMFDTQPLINPSDKEVWALSVEKETQPITIRKVNRTIEISFSAITTFLIIAIATVFLVFCLGVLVGKSIGSTPAENTSTAQTPVLPSKPQRFFSIKLYQWYNITTDYTTAIIKRELNAIVDALNSMGLKDAFWFPKQEGGSKSILLYYGKYHTADDPEIRKAYTILKNFKYRGKKYFKRFLTLEELQM